jgi:hypothetical protein
MLLNDAGQAVVALGICATVATVGVSIARAYVSGIEARKKSSGGDLAPDVQDRMTRIEQAVDAIAIEVERMSEGQRFTTRLLAEKLGNQASAIAGPSAASPTGRSGEHGTNGAGGTNGR